MIITDRRRRRAARAAARTGAAASAAMLALSAWAMASRQLPDAAAAGTDAGDAQVIHPMDGTPSAGTPLASGGSSTPFSLHLPTGAACAGDSANDGYRVQSYMVPASVDPSTLTFDFQGPTPFAYGTYATFRQPLYDLSPSAYVDAQTAAATEPGGPGPVVNLPAFSLGVFEPGNLPAGSYNIGIACTKGTASDAQLDKFWNIEMEVVADGGDTPAGVRWTAAAAQTAATTTTSSTSSTTSTSTSSTSTSTTTPGSTTTTTEAGATTTVTGGSTAAAAAAGGPTGGPPTFSTSVAGVSQLAFTGSTTSLVVWSALLLVLGRMSVLLGRTPQVRPAVVR